MENIKIFKNDELGQVRTIIKDGEIWFVAKDICECIGLSNPTIVVQRLDPDEVTKLNLGSLSGETNIVNEYGLYNLVLASRKNEAKHFKRWITHEVIPSIRKNGGYILNQETLSPEQLIANALVVAQRILAEKDKIIEEQKPKVIFADALSVSKSTILIGELAKILNQNGINVGQNRLFEWLRNNNYLIKRAGTDYNMPTQRAMDLEIFNIKERSIPNHDGSVRITKTVVVTVKGQQYFINKFLSKRGESN